MLPVILHSKNLLDTGMPSDRIETLELLAPARDAAIAMAAIAHGADAVYMGGPAFGARSAAGNSIADIEAVVKAAAPFGVKVYVTVNTILYDDELENARRVIEQLWLIGVDALIVQDPALLEMDIPPIDLHASTQWNSYTVDRVERLSRAGFSQIVVPREFSLDQISEAYRAIAGRSRLEVFVHGALCVSYSGGCYAGQVMQRRSANRGCCPQICRMSFTLTDGDGKPLSIPDGSTATRHWLSLTDMNRIDSLDALAMAGARSFKIEGRLKSEAYVKNVTAAYSRKLDAVVEASEGKFVRSSFGKVELTFTPDISRVFNRGFTRYFLRQGDDTKLASWKTPKWVGLPVAIVEKVTTGYLQLKGACQLNNGDGLSWFDSRGGFHGFRINRVCGTRIYPSPGSDIPSTPGTRLYRNLDTEFETRMARTDTARRVIPVAMTLRRLVDGRVALEAVDCRGCAVTVTSQESFNDVARSPQELSRRDVLSKLGNTVYSLESVEDRLGQMFVPASALTALRRAVTCALDSDWNIRRSRTLRRQCGLRPDEFAGMKPDYQANVANSLSRRFYMEHGSGSPDDALEISLPDADEVKVMTTRYCLRRELGACLRDKAAVNRIDTREMYLVNQAGKLRLAFDCANCCMNIYKSIK